MGYSVGSSADQTAFESIAYKFIRNLVHQRVDTGAAHKNETNLTRVTVKQIN